MKNEYIIEGNTTKIRLKNTKSDIIFEALIDTEDLELVRSIDTSWCAKFHKNIQGYYAVTGKTKRVGGKANVATLLLHRLVMGVEDRNQVVDHINHNTLDNRKSNLRVLSFGKNSINRQGANKNNKSGIRNVSWSSKEEKWLVQLQVNKRNKCFGKFPFEELNNAAELAKRLREELYEIE